jgi:hypothetical protein
MLHGNSILICSSDPSFFAERWIGPKSFARSIILSYLNEKDVLGSSILTNKHPSQIQDRFMGYSPWVLSPLWEHPDEFVSLYMASHQ